MTQSRRHYWERFPRSEAPPGADLAALRRGVGKEAGTAAQLWPYYTTLRQDGFVTDALRAEHLALTLYGVHQQSRAVNVHTVGQRLGTALRTIRASGRFSEEAVDRRVLAMATATSLVELDMHLRGLIGMSRSVNPAPGLDYTGLFRDLCRWQRPGGAQRVRRDWGSAYFSTPTGSAPDDPSINDEQESHE